MNTIYGIAGIAMLIVSVGFIGDSIKKVATVKINRHNTDEHSLKVS
ncbi:MAG: hypothetical protein ACR2IS_00230 [Nitrososphaeraceae archaeon]